MTEDQEDQAAREREARMAREMDRVLIGDCRCSGESGDWLSEVWEDEGGRESMVVTRRGRPVFVGPLGEAYGLLQSASEALRVHLAMSEAERE